MEDDHKSELDESRRSAVRCLTVLVFLVSSLLTANSFADFPDGVIDLPTPLVTGNGFGFATYSFTKKTVTKFYAHPYRFESPDPHDINGEGVETANFLKSLKWETAQPAEKPSADFLSQSHIISVRDSLSEQSYFLPFGLEQNTLIASRLPTLRAGSGSDTGSGACLRIEWAQAVKTDTVDKTAAQSFRVLTFNDVRETLILVPLSVPSVASPQANCLSGSTAWALISIEAGSDPRREVGKLLRWKNGLTPHSLVNRELHQVEAWRVKPKLHFKSPNERALWRQSEIILRMAQSREPNRPGRHNHGLIVASIPEGLWFVPWVRDMAYATLALIRMGHQAEARSAVRAYFDAQPVGRMQKEVKGFPYQISTVRYFGDGSEEPFFTMEGAPNIEYDNWGLVLWVLSEYVERFHDTGFLHLATHRGSIYESARDFIVTPLIGNLETFKDGEIDAADTSIWENYQWDKQHFAYSTATTIRGLKDFDRLTSLMRDSKTHKEIDRHLKLLGIGFKSAFIRNGYVAGTMEPVLRNEADGAVLSAINLVVVTDPQVIKGTLAEMELLKMPSGGYRRVRGDTEYEKQDFLFINFSIAEVYSRLKQTEKGAPLLESMVEKCAQDHNFVPEMYVSDNSKQFPGEIGAPTGAIPMVGYGAGVLITHLLNREALTH